jgi:hypothetical protein
MSDHVTDQLLIVLSVFTILVVAGNFVLLTTLLRRVHEWITATHELVSLLSNLSSTLDQTRRGKHE